MRTGAVALMKVFLTLVLVALVAGSVITYQRIDAGIENRRAYQHANDLRLCEVAINDNRANLRELIDDLTRVAPPPRDAAEEQARVASQHLFDQFLAPIDCKAFIATGHLQTQAKPAGG